MALRHDFLKKFFVKMCNTVGIGTRMEPHPFVPNIRQETPNLVLFFHTNRGRDLDFTLLNPTNPGSLKEAVKSGMSLLKKHEKAKSACHSKLSDQKECAFEPSVFLIFGGTTQHNMDNVINSIIKRVGENVVWISKLGSTWQAFVLATEAHNSPLVLWH